MYLNHPAGGSAWKRCWVNAHCSSFLDLGGKRPGSLTTLPWELNSHLARKTHSATRQWSSVLQTHRSHALVAVQKELCGRFCSKRTFSEWYQFWPVLAHLILHSQRPFCFGLYSTKCCVKLRSGRKWHLSILLGVIKNLWIQQKVDSFSPCLCQKISTHKKYIFREYCIRICQ